MGLIIVGHVGFGRTVFSELMAHKMQNDLDIVLVAEEDPKEQIPFVIKNIPIEMLEMPVLFVEHDEKFYGKQTKRKKAYLNYSKKFNKKIYNRKIVR